MEASRQALIDAKDLYYDYNYRIEDWQNSWRADSSLLDDMEIWQRRGVVEALPSEQHQIFLHNGTPLDISNALTPEAIRAAYGLPDSIQITPTLLLNTSITDSALAYKFDALTPNKGIITKGTPIILRGATLTQDKFDMLKALEANYDGSGEEINLMGRIGALAYILILIAAIAVYLN